MTRRLAAAALIAGSLGLAASPALANHHQDGTVCIGGDKGTGPMFGYCVDDPGRLVKIAIPAPPPPPGS